MSGENGSRSNLCMMNAISQGIMSQISSSTEYRSFFNVLKSIGIINIEFRCEELSAILGKNNLLPVESKSISRQWINIKLDPLINYVNVNYHDKDLIKKVLNRLKNNLFVKLSAKMKNDAYDINSSQEREIYFYTKMNQLLFDQVLPHTTSFFFSSYYDAGSCEQLNNIVVDEKSRFQNTLKKYFDSSIKKVTNDNKNEVVGYNLLVTELMENSKTFEDFIDSLPELADSDTILKQVMFQIMYSLSVFKELHFVHNDLHLGNIMIEQLETPIDYYYVLDNQVAQLRTRYLVRIFDFDRSYVTKGTDYLENKYNKMTFVKYGEGHDDKFDLYTMMMIIGEQYGEYREDLPLLISYVDAFLKTNYESISLRWPHENSTMDEREKIREHNTKQHQESIKNCMSVDDFFNLIANSGGVTLFKSLKEVPLITTSEIFIRFNSDLEKLRNDIRENEFWKGMSVHNRVLICHKLVDKSEFALCSGSLKQAGGSTYFDRYKKYKRKYKELKMGLMRV